MSGDGYYCKPFSHIYLQSQHFIFSFTLNRDSQCRQIYNQLQPNSYNNTLYVCSSCQNVNVVPRSYHWSLITTSVHAVMMSLLESLNNTDNGPSATKGLSDTWVQFPCCSDPTMIPWYPLTIKVNQNHGLVKAWLLCTEMQQLGVCAITIGSEMVWISALCSYCVCQGYSMSGEQFIFHREAGRKP